MSGDDRDRGRQQPRLQSEPDLEPAGDRRRAPGRGRALVVDDDALCRAFLGAVLEDMGLSVHEASNGVEAVDMCLGAGFDIVLMDIDMPVLDGVAALRRIRSTEAATRQAPVPVAMVSGRDDEATRRDALATGAQAFLGKPVTAVLLRKQVEELLRRSGLEGEGARECGQ